MAETALHLTEGTFDQELARHPGLLLVDFWAEWCAPCKAIAPVLEEVVKDAGGPLPRARVKVEDTPGLAGRYGIRSIPTILFVKGGKVLDQVIGAVPKSQLQKKLEALA